MINIKKEKQEQEIVCRFERLGVNKVRLTGLPLSVQYEVIQAFEKVFADFPILNGVIDELRVKHFPKDSGTEAVTVPNIINNKVHISIYLDFDLFSRPLYQKIYLWKELVEGYATGCGIQGVVIHELGHVLHMLADMKISYIAHDKQVSYSSRQLFAENYDQETSSNTARDAALAKLNLTTDDIVEHLSIYANTDADESVAEAFSEYYTRKKCRTLALEIVNELTKIL